MTQINADNRFWIKVDRKKNLFVVISGFKKGDIR